MTSSSWRICVVRACVAAGVVFCLGGASAARTAAGQTAPAAAETSTASTDPMASIRTKVRMKKARQPGQVHRDPLARPGLPRAGAALATPATTDRRCSATA